MKKIEEPTAEKRSIKADLLHRFLAKFIDFLIVGALSRILTPFGPLAGLTYLLIADGFYEGHSLGKKLMGMKVVQREGLAPCTFRESILRNLPLSIAAIFAMFPFFGGLFFSTGGLLIIGFESYLIFSDEEGTRIGDILADTLVIEEEKE